MEKEGVIESEIEKETPEKSGEVKPKKTYRKQLTNEEIQNMSLEELKEAVRKRERRDQRVFDEITRREGMELAQKGREIGKQEGALMALKGKAKKEPDMPPKKGASGGSAKPPPFF